MADHYGLPNDIGANFIQIAVLLWSVILPAVIKKRCCDRVERLPFAWRYDIIRLLATNITAFGALLVVAQVFDGDDCLNYYTVLTTDVCVGLCVEILAITLLEKDGYALGYYGISPGDKFRVVRQTILTCTLALLCRCLSGIIAITLFPIANERLSAHSDDTYGWWYMVVITPTVYHLLRLLCFDRPSSIRRYAPIRSDRAPPSESNGMFSITSCTDSDEDSRNPNIADGTVPATANNGSPGGSTEGKIDRPGSAEVTRAF